MRFTRGAARPDVPDLAADEVDAAALLAITTSQQHEQAVRIRAALRLLDLVLATEAAKPREMRDWALIDLALEVHTALDPHPAGSRVAVGRASIPLPQRRPR